MPTVHIGASLATAREAQSDPVFVVGENATTKRQWSCREYQVEGKEGEWAQSVIVGADLR